MLNESVDLPADDTETKDDRAKHADTVYLDSLRSVLSEGVERSDRTGTGTVSVFGLQSRYDLKDSFPLLTTKRVYTRGVFAELLFFLNGLTNNRWLNERRVTIWDEWQGADGDLGPVYGFQWRSFGAPYSPDGSVEGHGVDQIATVLRDLKTNPFSRRHIVSAWNPTQLEDMALPPCHTLFQFYVTPDEQGRPHGLSCQLYQRSADMFLGVPFNIASYAALTQLFAELTNLEPLEFVHTIGDAHVYLNHLEQVEEQLSRAGDLRPSPKLRIDHPFDPTVNVSFADYTVEDFVVEGYDPLPMIKAPVSV